MVYGMPLKTFLEKLQGKDQNFWIIPRMVASLRELLMKISSILK